MVALLEQPLAVDPTADDAAPLPFRHAIRFRDVSFRYTAEGPVVIDGVNLTIPRGARVGFIGATGSGKSTMMDLLMGLLAPTSGALLVDDTPVTGAALKAWQQTIAHVPQTIFLSDTSFAENIAFAVHPERIDQARVRRAAAQAQIAAFIDASRHGYDTVVGERGVRLSGGQRQRLGIARALYKQASVLVFDEATSALDSATEASVMEAIEGLDRDLTILIIAHRLTTVRRCDTIVEMSGGRAAVRAQLPQEELDGSRSTVL
jgi:ATP-binding cassette subfamily B protein